MKKLALILGLAALSATSLSAAPYQKLVAKVGNDMITAWDIEEAVNLVKMGMTPEEMNSTEGKARLEEARATVLENMINEKLVVMVAEKGPEGFSEAVESGRAVKNPFLPAETEVDSKMEKTFEQTRSRFPSQKVFEEELARERVTVRELRQRLRDRIRVSLTYDKMINVKRAEFRQQVRVSDDEAREFYRKEKKQFSVADQVRLRHILVSADNEKLARDIRARLEKGEAFAKLAERYSKDEFTSTKGGRLGWIEKGGLKWPALEKAAFGLKTGRVGGPIKTGEGWHVIRVDDRKSGYDQDFDTVKARITNVLYAEKINERLKSWLKSLREEQYVEVLE